MEDKYYMILALLLASSVWIATRGREVPLPPGPKGNFLVGNLYQLPRHQYWLTYTEWAKTYGNIFSLQVLTSKVIVLNSGKAVLDLLESRSNIYSDRPRSPIAEALGRHLSVFGVSVNHPRFKVYRKLLHSGLNSRAVTDYQQLQLEETKVFLRGLIVSPATFVPQIRRNAGAVILKVAYGYTVEGDDDLFVRIIEEGLGLTETISNTARFILEALPGLRWALQRMTKMKALAKDLDRMEVLPFKWAKQAIIAGNYTESFTSKLLEEVVHQDLEECQEIVKWTSAALYIGGADTTVSVLTSFFWLMAKYPDIQSRAQAEVDELVGEGLPNFDHLDSLPYVAALLKEVLRWGPVAPLGLRHSVTADDFYEGYRIPKGSTIIANIWAITHDEELYPDPMTFDPNRHLGNAPQTNPYKFVFGFGRRACPGAHFAQQSLLLNISSILAAFVIGKAKDGNGNVVEPPLDWSTGITSHIQPFPITLTVRSKAASLFTI